MRAWTWTLTWTHPSTWTGARGFGRAGLALGMAVSMAWGPGGCAGDDGSEPAASGSSGDATSADDGGTMTTTPGDGADDTPGDSMGDTVGDTVDGTMDGPDDTVGDTMDGPDDTMGDATETGDPDQDPLEGMGALELLADGYLYTEGPLWSAAGGHLTFTDISGDTIYRYTPGEGVVVFRGPTVPPSFSNGLAWDLDGTLIACEHSPQRITRGDAAEETLADMWMGQVLNAPNDVVVHSGGGMYFTDPALATMPQFGGVTTELDFQGVYRIAPDGTLELLWDQFPAPNGVGLSPDESTLVVTDTTLGAAFTFDLDAAGVPMSDPTQIYDQIPIADGMCVDANGNLYMTSELGVVVTRPDGTLWGTIAVPARPANCAFGGDDLRTLYITAQDALHSVELAVPGLPVTG
ncbi:MAG: SMP-30/gluconolactonase/LRE family protein [Myxococcota bacterium]